MDILTKSKSLRKKLKEAGYNSKRISVTTRNYSSINVKLKDDNFTEEEIKKIKNIALDFEKVDYCNKSGEILAGGNDFVFITSFEGYMI